MPVPKALPFPLLAVVALLASNVYASVEYSQKQREQSTCCTSLQAALPGKVLLRGIDNITASTELYWSAQVEEQKPACVVLPTSASDVSVAVKILGEGVKQDLEYCDFALRSGGHTPFPNINNIDDGVTLDLSNLNTVDVNCDLSSVGIGPGNRWEDVYTVTDSYNISVVGGRSRTVGVGGLVLSGGMSFFSPRYGLPCENVANYEIVLSNGSIVNANATSSSDLFKALKGGSNNFGVVTRLDLKAFPQGNFWGGMGFYNSSSLPSLVTSFTKYANTTEQFDPYAQMTLLFGVYQNSTIVMTHQHYTKPEEPPTALYSELTPLQVQNTFRIDSLKNFTIELETKADGGIVRKAFATATFGNSATMLQSFTDDAMATMSDLKSVAGLQFIVSYQAFGNKITSITTTDGNFLGLTDSDGDRVLACLTVSWSDIEDDDKMNEAIRTLTDRVVETSKELDVFDDYVFMNYAAPWQDVWAGVGDDNHEEFRRISKKYDPVQMFQNQVPGGFKL